MPDVVLEVRGLVKRYGAATAVDQVSFELYRGETLTLLGPERLRQDHHAADGRRARAAGRGRDPRSSGAVVDSAEQRVFVPPEKRNMGMVFQSLRHLAAHDRRSRTSPTR